MKISEELLPALEAFVVEANRTAGYASPNPKIVHEPDGSYSIFYRSKDGKWEYHDKFFGGEPYSGLLLVRYEGRPAWDMVYYGWVIPEKDHHRIFAFLKKALAFKQEENPFRGPAEYIAWSLRYLHRWKGKIGRFQGSEGIIERDNIGRWSQDVYFANYSGGLIDQRRD